MIAKNSGFTLVETLLVIALIVIVSGLTLPVVRSLQTANDVDVAATSLAQNLRQAQLLAESGSQNDNWGVQISTGSIVLYRGTTYASRITAFDLTTAIASSINISGLSEVNFSKSSGNPSVNGNIVLNGLNGKTTTLSINSKGIVSY